MPSITSWLRLEPRSRDDDVQNGLQAKVHDPLWMLGRQWQFNEFQGQDSGSPVAVKLEADAMELTRCFLGPLPATGTAAGAPFDASTIPLETMVEREPYAQAPAIDVRFAVDSGRQFVHVLESLGAPQHGATYLKQFPLQPSLDGLDAESTRFAKAMTGRVIDGAQLYKSLRPTVRPAQGAPTLPPVPPIPAADQDKVLAAAQNWLFWYESIASEPAGPFVSWTPTRMEYAFAVSAASAQGEIVLEAPDYREGALDWFSFAIRRPGTLGAAPGEARVQAIARNVIPAPASYPGMPAERWWEMEDAHIDFGSVRTLPGDLTGLVLLQFAVTYGNDWFVIPADLNIGSLVRVRAVTVTDGFGVATPVPAFSQTGAADGWRMFTMSGSQPGEPDLFFFPPTLPSNLTSPALETVLLTRDEMANMAWAIEKQVQDSTGKTIDRYYALEEPPATADGGTLNYRAATSVPDNWIPLVPVTAGVGRIRLRRGVLESALSGAKGRILTPGGPLVIEDEEVPRTGARVTRKFQYARWSNGSTHLWIGRQKEPGRGEASSGLEFDVAL